MNNHKKNIAFLSLILFIFVISTAGFLIKSIELTKENNIIREEKEQLIHQIIKKEEEKKDVCDENSNLVKCFNSNLSQVINENKELKKVNIDKNKKTLLIFFSPKCPDCKTELTHLSNIIEEIKNKSNLILIASTKDSKENINKFLKECGIDIEPNIIDADFKTISAVNSRFVPTTVFFDEEGDLLMYHIGTGISTDEIKNSILN